jgi:hypothetical protein
MNRAGPSLAFFIGWDVGGWNCSRNPRSRDAIVVLDETLTLVGQPWRGNLRGEINQATGTRVFLDRLFSLCRAGSLPDAARVTLAIDTPLGFSQEFVQLVTRQQYTEPIEGSSTNPYLYRQTERYLFERGLRPLSAIKDMIGSQATKGIHVLAKFAPAVERCGVWRGGTSLTVLEAYPAACKSSPSIAALRQQIADQPRHPDKQDALTCALIAYLFAQRPEQLIAPSQSVPASEGWIWVPQDMEKGRSP